MPKLLLRILMFLVVVSIGFVGGIFAYKYFTVKSTPESKHQLSLEKIEQMGKLELVRITIKDIQKQTLVRPMPFPDAKALLIVVGEVSAGIDLKNVTQADIVDSDTHVTVTLPNPQILMSKINHSKSQVYDVTNGLLNTVELIDEAYKAAEPKIREAAIEIGYAETCKQNARQLLTPIFSALARKKVVIEFKN